MKSRGIQEEALDGAISSFRSGGTYHLLQAPVAFGKTIFSSALMKHAVDEFGAKCLFLAHLTELVVQTVEKFNAVAPELSCGVFMGKDRQVEDIIVGTRQTVEKHLDLIGAVNLIIIDEVHLYGTQYQKIVDHFLALNPRLRVLGVTGTPFNLKDGWMYGEKKMWPEPCFVAHIDEMIELGYLSKYRYKMADAMDELENVGKSKGEFKEGELEDILTEERHMGSVRHVIDEYCQGRKRIMIFCVTIDHAEELAKFLGVGCVHSRLKKEEWRDRVDRFKNGDDRILVNVTQLTVGFDCPEVDCLIVARPTMSPSLHVQICGRGLRVVDGKENCLIIDMVGNYLRHGLPSNPKIRAPKEKQEDREKKEKATNVCHECFEIVEGGETICPNCGAVLTAKKEIEEINEKVRLMEIEAEKNKHRVERYGEKQATTKQGNNGVRFWLKVTGRDMPLFKFCGSGTQKIEKTRERLNRLKIGDAVDIVATAYGDWTS